MPEDPYDWKALGYDSYETFIEAKAGACPPEPGIWDWPAGVLDRDWPMPEPPPFPADDEGEAVPDE